MEITLEIKGLQQKFRTTISGITKQNVDGTERQKIVSKCRTGEWLTLVREPDNPYDKYAIAVYTSVGQQLGYVPKRDMRLADHMDMAGEVWAQVVKVTGGPGLLGIFMASRRKNYGCVIQITKGSFDWDLVRPFMDADERIQKIIAKAKSAEARNQKKAVTLYRKAIAEIEALDSRGSIAMAWRRARYPINRLTLLVERARDLQGSYEEILRYERFPDCRGLSAVDGRTVQKRKLRLEKKLGL